MNLRKDHYCDKNYHVHCYVCPFAQLPLSASALASFAKLSDFTRDEIACRLDSARLALLSNTHTLKIVEKSILSCDLFFTNRSLKPNTTLNNGYLGSRNDEERSEMRYVVRIAGCMRVIESLNAYCARGFGREHVCLSVTDIFQLPPFWWGVRT